MTIKTELISPSPGTQCLESIVELLNYLGRPAEPLPESLDLGAVKLGPSNKGDSLLYGHAKDLQLPELHVSRGTL